MSTKFEKLIAKRELESRQIERFDARKKRIEDMSDEELRVILNEPDEDEDNKDD